MKRWWRCFWSAEMFLSTLCVRAVARNGILAWSGTQFFETFGVVVQDTTASARSLRVLKPPMTVTRARRRREKHVSGLVSVSRARCTKTHHAVMFSTLLLLVRASLSLLARPDVSHRNRARVFPLCLDNHRGTLRRGSLCTLFGGSRNDFK